ncbi:DUF4012 domain-containing protein [Candidatus Gottesmanbacteria bacterium]|nr:DUF4012 domain-containing protein [Candidatus Gottesmanbacteria bacterium]
MPHKKTLELVEEKNSPRALIIGGSLIAPYLSDELSKNGCSVTMEDSYYPSLGRFNYIFQFGNYAFVKDAVAKHLFSDGKVLFIETDEEEVLEKIDKVKVLSAGGLFLWKQEELVSLILKTIFSTKGKEVVNLRKMGSQTQKIYKQTVSAKPKTSKPIVPAVAVPVFKKSRILNRKIFFFSIILSSLVIFLLSIFYPLFSLKRDLNTLRSDVASGSWQAVPADIKKSRDKLSSAQNIYNFILQIFFPLKNISYMKDSEKILTTTDRLLAAGEDMLSFSTQLQKNSFNSGVTLANFSKENLSLLKNRIVNLQEIITRSKMKIDEVQLPFFPKSDYIFFLTSFSQKLAAINDLLPTVDGLFLPQEPKVYLVLFQNNMELRPTGGFIGSFGLVTIEKGKVIDFKIEDVYTADGQLKGHIDPPIPISKYLNQPHFFLRDSNFDPDFAASSVKASFFLQKELGTNVDGVIGINLFVLQKILQIIGPVKIADFGGDLISADNFFFKAQYYSTEKFFPGSTQKKDFLTSLNNTLMQKFENSKSLTLIQLLPVIKQSLDEKNILLFSTDEKSQKIIEKNGWGGRLVEIKCVANTQIESCFSDYLAVIEANLGVNKANYFIIKSVTVEKKIDTEGKIETLVTLAYENSASSEIFGEVIYTNYLRLFVPAGSQLINITFNGMELSSSEVDIENYGLDKMSFGFLLKIAPENKGVVKVRYTLPRFISPEISSYQFFYQKQGGDKVAPLVLSLNSPSQYFFKPTNFKSTSEKEIFYSTDTSVDRIFSFSR